MDDLKKCRICGKGYKSYGNNPQPVCDGRCCDRCNLSIVIPERKRRLLGSYKVGDRIHIIHLHGEDTSYDGREGSITYIDDIGQLHGDWGGLAVIPTEDEFYAVKALWY